MYDIETIQTIKAQIRKKINELKEFIKDISNNTPHEGQFDEEEEDLDKDKKNNHRSR